jgi:hypothetical protein
MLIDTQRENNNARKRRGPKHWTLASDRRILFSNAPRMEPWSRTYPNGPRTESLGKSCLGDRMRYTRLMRG